MVKLQQICLESLASSKYGSIIAVGALIMMENISGTVKVYQYLSGSWKRWGQI